MKKISTLLSFCLTVFLAHAQCPPATAYDYLDINNVKARINNGGDMWWDLNSEAEYIVPKTGQVSSLFSGAIWIGGIDAQGQLHMAAQTYRQNGNDFFPGPLDENGNITPGTCTDFDKVWKVNRTDIDNFLNSGSASSSITNWPGNGNPNLGFLPGQDLAPFVDVNNDGKYDPADGDYPDIPGDQALWFVFNDAGNNHTETGGEKLGIEVQCLAYGFKNTSPCINNATFYHYKIINKSANDYDSIYMGLWTDPDLGCYTDDYLGTDPAYQLGIVYNSDAVDGPCLPNYGNAPPVLAIQFLRGPTDDSGNVHYLDYGMMYYNDFSVLGNPENPEQYYQYLKSIWKDGTHLKFGGNGYGGATNTNYVFSADPSIATGWSMCGVNAFPADVRIITSSGPVSLNSGTAQTLDYAVLWDNTSAYPCPSYAIIDSVASCTKNVFDEFVSFTGEDVPLAKRNAIKVFPDPASPTDAISFKLMDVSLLDIFDVEGRKLREIVTGNQNIIQLDATAFSSGIYFFRAYFSDHSIKTGKFVID